MSHIQGNIRQRVLGRAQASVLRPLAGVQRNEPRFAVLDATEEVLTQVAAENTDTELEPFDPAVTIPVGASENDDSP